MTPVSAISRSRCGAWKFETPIERVDRVAVPVGVVAAFGRDVDLIARQTGGSYRLPHALLVAVDLRGVDVAVAGSQRLADHLGGAFVTLGALLGDLPHAEAELRDRRAVVESDVWDLVCAGCHEGNMARSTRSCAYLSTSEN